MTLTDAVRLVNGSLTLSPSITVTVEGTLHVTDQVVVSGGSTLNLTQSRVLLDGIFKSFLNPKPEPLPEAHSLRFEFHHSSRQHVSK